MFELNGNSAAGLDGFSGCFFQKYWDIVASDITNVLRLSSVDINYPGMSHVLI